VFSTETAEGTSPKRVFSTETAKCHKLVNLLKLPNQFKLACLEELATALSTRFNLLGLPFETCKA
jgi:hypothetical protein